jgi:hypothetical protein
MALFEKFGERQAVKLITHYTGKLVKPELVLACQADIQPGWRGVVVITNDSLWLVNRLGARGINLERLSKGFPWGQYPPETRGYPAYDFTFLIRNSDGDLFARFVITMGAANGPRFLSALSVLD